MKLLWGDNSLQNLEYETYARLFENRIELRLNVLGYN